MTLTLNVLDHWQYSILCCIRFVESWHRKDGRGLIVVDTRLEVLQAKAKTVAANPNGKRDDYG